MYGTNCCGSKKTYESHHRLLTVHSSRNEYEQFPQTEACKYFATGANTYTAAATNLLFVTLSQSYPICIGAHKLILDDDKKKANNRKKERERAQIAQRATVYANNM